MSTVFTVYPGSSRTGLTATNDNEYIRISSGGTASNSTVTGGGEMTVFSGGKASATLLKTNGVLFVSKGGSATGNTVSGGGSMVLLGGRADTNFIKPQGIVFVSKGGLAYNTSNAGGVIQVSSGGTAKITALQDNGSVFVYSGGVADITHFYLTKGSMFVSGGKAYETRLLAGGLLEICSGGLASDTVLSGGSMTVFDGRTIDTNLQKGAVAVVSSGGSMKKTIVSANSGSGAELHLRYEAKATDTTVDFLGKMYVSNGGTADKTALNGSMYVSAGGIASRTTVSGGSMIVSNGGSAANTIVSGGSIILSNGGMANGTTVASEGSMYVSGGGSATKTTVNGGYMAVSDGATANGVTVKKWDAMVVFSKGASASNVVVSGGEVLISSGAVVTGLTNANKNALVKVAKGAIVSKCKGRPLDFEDADYNNDRKGVRPDSPVSIPSLEKIAKDTSKLPLDKDGTVSMNGMINFVGPEDEFDYAKISLSKSAASVSFRIEATGAAKFTIWKWTGSKMVSLQSTSLKKDGDGKYTVSTKNCVLEKDGDDHEYYISVQALNVKNGGFAYYNVYLNTGDCIYYNKVDNGNNNWMVDSEKNLNYLSDVSSISLGLTSKQLQVDKTSVNKGSWKNFVGHDDDTDYAKISVTQNLKATFTVEANDAAKFTVYQIVGNGKGDYSLKSVKTKTLTKKNGQYAATLSGVSLKSENDYCICMKSTNAKKGGNAYYNVSYSAVSADSAALSGPEVETNGWDDSVASFAADSVSADADILADADVFADAGLVMLSGADLADLRMSGVCDPAASPIPVAASDDLFAGLDDATRFEQNQNTGSLA